MYKVTEFTEFSRAQLSMIDSSAIQQKAFVKELVAAGRPAGDTVMYMHN